MNLLFWGLTISLIGKAMIALGVLMAHGKIAQEKRIDKAVIHSFHVEQLITAAGLLLIVLGYFMEIYFYGFTPLLTCSGAECAASVGSLLLPN